MSQIGYDWFQKPIGGTPLDWSNSLCKGLISFVPTWQSAVSNIQDIVGNLALAATGTPAFNAPGACEGLKYNAATTYSSAVVPAGSPLLLPSWPATLAFGGQFLASVNNVDYFGLVSGTGTTSEFISFSGGAGNLAFAASGVTLSTGALPPLNSDAVVALSVSSTAQLIYKNGILSTTLANSLAAPTWTGTTNLFIGGNSGTALNDKIVCYWLAIWNRMLTVGEHQTIGANVNAIWQMFEPMIGVDIMAGAQTSHHSLFRPATLTLGSGGPFFQTPVNA